MKRTVKLVFLGLLTGLVLILSSQPVLATQGQEYRSHDPQKKHDPLNKIEKDNKSLDPHKRYDHSNKIDNSNKRDNKAKGSNSTPVKCEEYGPLGIPKWFRGLVDANCEVIKPEDQLDAQGNVAEDGLQRFISILLLNIADMLLRCIGLIATGFIIWGGFKYMLARADPNKIISAKKTIINSIIGLVIAMISMTIVSFVFNFFKK